MRAVVGLLADVSRLRSIGPALFESALSASEHSCPYGFRRVTQLLDQFGAEARRGDPHSPAPHADRRHARRERPGRDRLNVDPGSVEIAARGVDDTAIASHAAYAARLALPDQVDGRAFLQGGRRLAAPYWDVMLQS